MRWNENTWRYRGEFRIFGVMQKVLPLRGFLECERDVPVSASEWEFCVLFSIQQFAEDDFWYFQCTHTRTHIVSAIWISKSTFCTYEWIGVYESARITWIKSLSTFSGIYTYIFEWAEKLDYSFRPQMRLVCAPKAMSTAFNGLHLLYRSLFDNTWKEKRAFLATERRKKASIHSHSHS